MMYYDDNADLDPEYEQKVVQGKQRQVLKRYWGEDILTNWTQRLATFLKGKYQEVFGNVLFDLCFQSKFLRGNY